MASARLRWLAGDPLSNLFPERTGCNRHHSDRIGRGEQEQLLAVLLMFRFLYHLVPLSIALLLFGGVELWRSFLAKPQAVAAASNRRIELEPDHAGDDQRRADDAHGIDGFAEEHHADKDAADGADPGPYRVRRAKWK
jgi:hypothetical protein